MFRLLYTLLYYSLIPLLFLRLIIKHQKSSAYKEHRQSLRLAERLGLFTKPDFSHKALSPVWIHTVSVGEFLAALPLIKQLLQDYPQHPIVITCTTTTGSAQIKKTFSQQLNSGQIFHVYLPYDLPGSMRRFLKAVNPCLSLIMETEIWPNLLNVSAQLDIPVCLLNARMSARSAKGYRRFSTLTKSALNQFSSISAQTAADAERLTALGAKKALIHVTGSIKFDFKINSDEVKAGEEIRTQLHWQDKKVLIAASTHKGEDEIILGVFHHLKQQFPTLVMIVVPRHPERFQSVYELLSKDNYNVLKRSQMLSYTSDDCQQSIDILVGDSMGEMIRYFSCADVVFMGGTMVSTGGHNILEPAALGLPVICGPHMFNFAAINELFLQHEAMQQVTDVESLENTLKLILSDEKMARAMGEQAKELMSQNSGALDKMMVLISSYLD